MKRILLTLTLLFSFVAVHAQTQTGGGGTDRAATTTTRGTARKGERARYAIASLPTCNSGSVDVTVNVSDGNRGQRTCREVSSGVYGWVDDDGGVYLVLRFATGGTGTSNDPWTGWDTAITWAGGKTYKFSTGYFAYNTSPNFALDGIRLIGEAGSVLKHTGSGIGFKIDGGALISDYAQNLYVENINVLGNSATTTGVLIKHANKSTFNRLRVSGASGVAILCEFNVLNTFYDPIASVNIAAFPSGARPTRGIMFTNSSTAGGSATATASTANTVFNSMFEGMSGTGIYLDYCDTTTFLQGTSEGNGGLGIETSVNSKNDVFKQLHLEGNSGGGMTLDGFRIVAEQVQSSNTTTIGATSNNVQIKGGIYEAGIVINSGAFQPVVEDVMQGNFALTDNGTSTRLWHNRLNNGSGSWVYRDSQIKNNVRFYNNTTIDTLFSTATRYAAAGGSEQWKTYLNTGTGYFYLLDSVNSRTHAYFVPAATAASALSYFSSAAVFESNVTVNGDAKPNTAGTFNLGTAALPWKWLTIGSTSSASHTFVSSASTQKVITVPDASGTLALYLTGTTSSIGGSLLAAGACSSTTTTITGATTAMSVIATPSTYAGDGNFWMAYVSAADTVTTKVCAAVSGTPTASTYNLRVIK